MTSIIKIFNCPHCKEPTELEIIEVIYMEKDALIDGTIACKSNLRHRFTVRHGIIFFSNRLLPQPSDEEIGKALRCQMSKC